MGFLGKKHMTIGIYKLTFNGTDKVYVGQSEDIEGRYIDHISNIRTGRANSKVLKAVQEFGYPKLEILYICTKEDLDSIENETIELLDAVDNGFNVLKKARDIPRPITHGELNKNSKYTNDNIRKVFKLLVDTPEKSFENISKDTGISIETIRSISRGGNHKWLKSEYPEEYNKLEQLKGTRHTAKAKGIIYPEILSPEGIKYIVTNLSKFARDHKMSRSKLGDFLHYKSYPYKGWKYA